jgi:predicted translin family RNA/ssDNA-binding protein
MPSSDFVTWAWNGSTGHWRTIMENAYDLYCKSEDVDPEKYYFGVCDATGQIRHFYNALDKDDVNKMVQHIAIMLPK